MITENVGPKKSSIASMNSLKKRVANMTPEELAAYRKYQSQKSMESRARKRAQMTPEQRKEYNEKINAWARNHRMQLKLQKTAV